MTTTRQITKKILQRIAQSWSREKDAAQSRWLEHEIQFQLDCSYGKACNHANDISIARSGHGPLAKAVRS